MIDCQKLCKVMGLEEKAFEIVESEEGLHLLSNITFGGDLDEDTANCEEGVVECAIQMFQKGIDFLTQEQEMVKRFQKLYG